MRRRRRAKFWTVYQRDVQNKVKISCHLFGKERILMKIIFLRDEDARKLCSWMIISCAWCYRVNTVEQWRLVIWGNWGRASPVISELLGIWIDLHLTYTFMIHETYDMTWFIWSYGNMIHLTCIESVHAILAASRKPPSTQCMWGSTWGPARRRFACRRPLNTATEAANGDSSTSADDIVARAI